MRKQKGFSLIELLIVVAIILIIAAIAIPNLLRSKMSANESAAASTVRTLNTSEVTFSTTYPDVGYGNTLTVLGPNGATCLPGTTGPLNACLVDNVLGCLAQPCLKGAYLYNINTSAPIAGANGVQNYPDYTIGAIPSGTTSGSKDFCSNNDAVVRTQPFAVGDPQPTLAICSIAPYAPLSN